MNGHRQTNRVPITRRTFLQSSSALSAGLLTGDLAAREPEAATPDQDRGLVERLGRLRPEHPRLHFTAADARRFRQHPGMGRARYARLLLEWVERNRDWSALANLEDRSDAVMEEEGAFVTNAALAFVLGGRKEHLELARRRALAMCRWPGTRAGYYNLGVYAASLARVYDWLHADLKPAETDQIRTSLAKIIRDLHDGSFAGRPGARWWAPLPLHHDYWIPVAGFGEAALALLGEVPEAAAWAAGALHLMEVSFSWMGPDGAWHEGVGDWCYALAPLLMFFGAWQSVVGENLHDRPWLRNTARYRLYHWLPTNAYIALNDSFGDGRYGPMGASCYLLRRLAALFRDGHAQWLADQDEPYDLKPGAKGIPRSPYEESSYRVDPFGQDRHQDVYCQAWNFLWYDASVPAQPPAGLPLAKHFPNQGLVIARTGWEGPATTVVSFTCAPRGGQHCAERLRSGEALAPGNLGHVHAAYNAVTLFGHGQYFVVSPGYARRSSRFQNTVTVNGAEFLTDPALPLRIVAFRTEAEFTYTVGDATAAFPADTQVAHYRRHFLLWNADGRLFLFDDLRLRRRDSGLGDFQWSLHSDPGTHRVTASGRKLVWESPNRKLAPLTVEIFEPQAFAWEQARLQAQDGTNLLEVHRLVRPEWYSDRMRVLAAFSPGVSSQSLPFVWHRQFLAVATGHAPGQPLVGFALAPLRPEDLENVKHPLLKNRELKLFGYDPGHPDAYLSKKDATVRIVDATRRP